MQLIRKMLMRVLEPIASRMYPEIALKAMKVALDMQEKQIWNLVNSISKEDYNVIIIMNPLTARGVLEVAKAEITPDDKKELKKKRFEVITNND